VTLPADRTPADLLPGYLPASYRVAGESSFTEFLTRAAPHMLPGVRPLPSGVVGGVPGGGTPESPAHATTIVAISCADGIVMAGDRRATMGNLIASRDIQKVHPADTYSLIGMAGTAGVGIELIKLFQVELEHYEKIDGKALSLDGKANRLATLVRNNLGAAMQGLAVIPLFAGFDLDAADPAHIGRIFSFDVAGGVYEETGYDAIGSGSLFAKSSLKKTYRAGITTEAATRLAVEALYDAADDDTATGGPDLTRRLFPVVMTANASGTRKLTDAEAAAVAEAVVARRMENPGG